MTCTLKFRLSLAVFFLLGCALAQQLPSSGLGTFSLEDDPDFNPKIEKPAYTDNGPRVLFSYRPTGIHLHEGFLKLLRVDGYRVEKTTDVITPSSLLSTDILVIVEPGEFVLQEKPDTVLSEAEAAVVHDWVVQGGSLLIASDGPGCDALLRRFESDSSHGHVGARKSGLQDPDSTSFLAFTTVAGTLADHAIVRGDGTHPVRKVSTMPPQTFKVPPGALALFVLPEGTQEQFEYVDDAMKALQDKMGTSKPIETMSPDELPKKPVMVTLPPPRLQPTKGRAPGVVLVAGRGRVVLISSSSTISAQVANLPAEFMHLSGRTQSAHPNEMRFGMNRTGTDNLQFTLNVMHWLSHLLN